MFRRVLKTLPLLVLTGGLLATVPSSSARAAGTQVWVLVHVVELDGDHQQVDVRFPIQALREMNGKISCDDGKTNVQVNSDRKDGDLKGADRRDADRNDSSSVPEDDSRGSSDAKTISGRDLYRQYKDLALGEERLVETADCHDSRVTIRVRSDEAQSAPAARHIRILIQGEEKGDKNLDLGISLDTLDDLGGFLGFLDHGKHADRIRELEDLPGTVDLLKTLPPFELVRVQGPDGKDKIVVRTE